MRTEAVIAIGATVIALLLWQVHSDALAKQRLTQECERYEREV